eukprot:GEMP01012897.1.p2 GENE.GEMP01012897.1~~GEMP01012897.1.p2  ORF type:complete len:398 (+),score=67.99 GEMP01012897.1:190-1383(+)
MCVAALLLGEGNFSFAHAAANLIKKQDPRVFEFFEIPNGESLFLSCSSFDGPREMLLGKYPESVPLFQRLERHDNIEIVHHVNAWDTETYPKSRGRWSRILWNHPHLGVENFKLHRFLMSHLFYTTAQVLEDDGIILVTLVKGQAQRWDLKGSAQKHGLVLIKAKPFVQSDYDGYAAKRNCHAKSFKSQNVKEHHQSAMQSYTFCFAKGALSPAIYGTDYTEPAGVEDELDAHEENRPAACLETIKVFRCQPCNKAFATAQGLRTHQRQVHELDKYDKFTDRTTATLSCETCDRVFHDEEARLQHKLSKHGKVRDGLLDHLFPCEETKRAHQEGREGFTACEICGQSVPDGWGMEQHKEALKPLLGLEARCMREGCGKTFLEYRALIQHTAHCITRG